jgi:hypothetical protein
MDLRLAIEIIPELFLDVTLGQPQKRKDKSAWLYLRK